MRNSWEKVALRPAETQNWLDRLKPCFSDHPNISRFDANDFSLEILRQARRSASKCPPCGAAPVLSANIEECIRDYVRS